MKKNKQLKIVSVKFIYIIETLTPDNVKKIINCPDIDEVVFSINLLVKKKWLLKFAKWLPDSVARAPNGSQVPKCKLRPANNNLLNVKIPTCTPSYLKTRRSSI